MVNNLLLEWKSPLNSFGLNRYERCYQSDYECKDNTFRLAAIKYPLRNLVERSAAILIARLLFYYRSNRSKYRFERCAFSLRTLQMTNTSLHLQYEDLLKKHESSFLKIHKADFRSSYLSKNLGSFYIVEDLISNGHRSLCSGREDFHSFLWFPRSTIKSCPSLSYQNHS